MKKDETGNAQCTMPIGFPFKRPLNALSFYQTIVKSLVLLLAVWFGMSCKQDGILCGVSALPR